MSLKRHREIYPKRIEAPTAERRPDDSLDEFPAAYSLTRLLSSMRVSASPAGVDHAPRHAQLETAFQEEKTTGLL
jgi:hypothetical protein